ncbi:toxic anion resistance protein [Lachnospiraceae bacterium]|nr:toxic anion resistance protein [Lachnospiraceae bacterium]
MSEEFKEFTEKPVLTLEPFLEKETVAKDNKKEPVWDDSILSEEEQRMVDQFVGQIDLYNSNIVLQYGAGTQKKMADFSEKALANVQTKDLGEIGELITNVVTELKGFDAEEEKGFLGFFKKSSQKLSVLKTKYDKAEMNVNKIIKVLEGHQVQLLKDSAILDKMYEQNKVYFKELSMYVIAGKRKLEQVRKTDLPALVDKANRSGLPEDAQEAKDLEELCTRFEKKIHDLELTRMISIQTAPQIRLVQNNDTIMVEKIQSTIVNTIPLWKSQMIIAMGVEHSVQAAQAQREVTDLTNDLLKKNAEKLKTATIETARESERGVVDMETLRITNESLISTLDEVMRIQKEGKQKRREAEQEIHRLEEELKKKLLQLQG